MVRSNRQHAAVRGGPLVLSFRRIHARAPKACESQSSSTGNRLEKAETNASRAWPIGAGGRSPSFWAIAIQKGGGRGGAWSKGRWCLLPENSHFHANVYFQVVE